MISIITKTPSKTCNVHKKLFDIILITGRQNQTGVLVRCHGAAALKIQVIVGSSCLSLNQSNDKCCLGMATIFFRVGRFLKICEYRNFGIADKEHSAHIIERLQVFVHSISVSYRHVGYIIIIMLLQCY